MDLIQVFVLSLMFIHHEHIATNMMGLTDMLTCNFEHVCPLMHNQYITTDLMD